MEYVSIPQSLVLKSFQLKYIFQVDYYLIQYTDGYIFLTSFPLWKWVVWMWGMRWWPVNEGLSVTHPARLPVWWCSEPTTFLRACVYPSEKAAWLKALRCKASSGLLGKVSIYQMGNSWRRPLICSRLRQSWMNPTNNCITILCWQLMSNCELETDQSFGGGLYLVQGLASRVCLRAQVDFEPVVEEGFVQTGQSRGQWDWNGVCRQSPGKWSSSPEVPQPGRGRARMRNHLRPGSVVIWSRLFLLPPSQCLVDRFEQEKTTGLLGCLIHSGFKDNTVEEPFGGREWLRKILSSLSQTCLETIMLVHKNIQTFNNQAPDACHELRRQ